MTKIFSIILLAVVLLFGANSPAHASEYPNFFPSEQAAQQHCPSDTVVWLDIPSGVYHFKGQRWYGDTKSGAYICEKEANQAGDRPTRNGQ